MRSAFLSFLTACPLLVCAGTNGFLSTVAEFSSTNSYTGHQLRPFRLEGRCLATDANGLILEDATGRTVLHLANDSHVPTSGARVLVTGSACLGWLGDLYNDISQRGADVQSPETPSNASPPVAFAETTVAELSRCLFDLKGPALGERDFAKAIRQTLTTLDLPDDMSVDVSVRRSRFDDTTAHAVLCIIRELAANALRHGHATSLAIAGAETDGIAEFSVTDNGCGFDPAHRPGAADGHFGLDGITDRVRRLGGTLDITSAPGKGTCAVIRIRP